MKGVKLTPKASQDLEDISYYGCQQFGEEQADRYINQKSGIFKVMSDNNIGTPRPEQGEDICTLLVERHMIYFLQTDYNNIVIRVLVSIRMQAVASTGNSRNNHIVLREN